jgi:hypothetical protein
MPRNGHKSLEEAILMDVQEYLKLTDNTNDSWDVIAMHPNEHLYLMKDKNSICYIATCDYTHTMIYWMVIRERVLGCFAADNPMRKELPKLAEMAKNAPSRISTILLNDEDMMWVESDNIQRMVRCIEEAIV